jgi:hypothetical protein
MVEAGGARDIDAAVNRMDPGRARIGHDNARRAEDRQAADNAEPGIHRFRGKPLAVRNSDLDLDIAAAMGRRRNLGDGFADHAARHRVDGGLARRHGKPGAGDGADARAGPKRNAAAGRARANRGKHQRAMGHVGIIAGILDDTGRRRVRVATARRQREGHPFAARQRDFDRVGKFAGQQRRIGGLGGRRGAGAGGPAPAEWAMGAHRPAYSATGRARHGCLCLARLRGRVGRGPS